MECNLCYLHGVQKSLHFWQTRAKGTNAQKIYFMIFERGPLAFIDGAYGILRRLHTGGSPIQNDKSQSVSWIQALGVAGSVPWKFPTDRQGKSRSAYSGQPRCPASFDCVPHLEENSWIDGSPIQHLSHVASSTIYHRIAILSSLSRCLANFLTQVYLEVNKYGGILLEDVDKSLPLLLLTINNLFLKLEVSITQIHEICKLISFRDELFETFRRRHKGVMDAEEVQLAVESLHRMLLAFCEQTKGQKMPDDIADQQLLEMVMARYEKEVMHPLQNLLSGELAQAMLIQASPTTIRVVEDVMECTLRYLHGVQKSLHFWQTRAEGTNAQKIYFMIFERGPLAFIDGAYGMLSRLHTSGFLIQNDKSQSVSWTQFLG